MRLTGLVGSFLLFTSLLACAQPKETTRNNTAGTKPKIEEASVQRTLPGRPESKIETAYKLRIVWLSDQAPEALYIRGGESWTPLSIQRLEQGDGQAKDGPAIPLSAIRKGNTVHLASGREVSAPTTLAIPGTSKFTLVFKTKDSNWQYLAITNMTKQPDIVMP